MLSKYYTYDAIDWVFALEGVVLIALLIGLTGAFGRNSREDHTNYKELVSEYVARMVDEYVIDILSEEKVRAAYRESPVMVLVVSTNEGSVYNVQCKTRPSVCYSINRVK